MDGTVQLFVNAVIGLAVLLGMKLVQTMWDEIKALRKAKHRHSQFLVRHESAIGEVRDVLNLEPLPPIVDTDGN